MRNNILQDKEKKKKKTLSITKNTSSKNFSTHSYKDWQKVKLGDAVIFKNGKTRPKSKGNIPVYGGNGILGYTSKQNQDKETIIIGRVGAYCGSVYFENKPIWVSDNALSAKPKDNNDSKFFYYF